MINIVYAGNKAVYKGILLSVMSMIKTCKEPIKIFLLSMDLVEQNPNYKSITKEQTNFLTKIMKNVNSESEAVLVDVGPIYNDLFKDSKNKNSEYTPYTLNRLFLDMIDYIPDKIVYIDADTMIVNDISELYNVNMDGYEYAAALDYMGKFWISPTYTNNGVLVMNIKLMRETGMLEKSRELVRTKWMKMPDQTAMYKSVTSKKYIEGKFNEQRDIKPDTVVKHFCKGIKWTPFFHIYNIKQWDIDNVHKKLKIHDFDDIYDIYQQLCEKYDFILN